MTCPHLPGLTRLLWRPLALACMAVTLALSQAPVAEAAPKKAAPKTTAKATAKTSAKASSKTTAKKATSVKSGAAGTRKAATVCTPAPAKSKKAKGRKHAPAAACKPGTAKTTAGTAAAAGVAAMAATPTAESPTQGVRLPLMLRTVPSLPDSPAALQARLDSIVAAQGVAGANVQVSGVRQLAPDIYAFSLQCTDAEQCQRLRLAIENERDWVAGLQLDERRNIPRPPERSSPAAR